MITPTQAWALAAVALFLKIIGTAVSQGVVRVKNNAFAKPEDAAVFGKGAPAVAQELPTVERAQNALRNDGENLPYFLALSLAYVQLGCWETGALIYFPIYVLARYAHTALMIRPKQPFRTMSYSLGTLIQLVLSGHIIAKILT